MTTQANGTIYLVVSKQTYEYDTDQYQDDGIFIDIGMKNQEAFDKVTGSSSQKAVIGATILNHDVWAPGTGTRIRNWPFAVSFKKCK